MSRLSSTSTPAVGSSRNRISGSCESALAIMWRRFMPPDSVMILASFFSHSDRSFRSFSISAGLRGLPNRPRLNDTSSHTFSKALVVEFLRHQADHRAGGAIVRDDVVAGDRDLAGARLDDAADDVDQRRLAGAVRPEQRENLAAADVQVDALQRLEAAGVGLRNA